MKTQEELESSWVNTPQPSKNVGEVTLLCLRPSEGERVLPASVEVTPEDGFVGDRWTETKHGLDDQIAVMMDKAANLVATEKCPVEMVGDNLLVTMDLSEDAISVGTQVRVGTATAEVTPKPHHGCAKFSARFGSDALKWINGKAGRSRRLRGLYLRILTAGTISLGDKIEVVEP